MFTTSKTLKYGQAVLSRNLTTSIVASQKKRDDALEKEFEQLNRGEFGGRHRKIFSCNSQKRVRLLCHSALHLQSKTQHRSSWVG